MPPAVPLPHGIMPREALGYLHSLDAHSAFDGLEPSAMAELSAHSTEIDMGLVDQKIRKVRAQHGEIERGTTEGDE